MNYIEQNRLPDFKDELLQLKSIFTLFWKPLFSVYVGRGRCVCVYEWMPTCSSQHLLFDFHQPHLICETSSHWTWGSLTQTKQAGQQASGNLLFYFPSTEELLGLQEPIITLAIMWEHFTNQDMAQPHESLFLRVPMKKKMNRRFTVLTTNKSYIKGS